MMGWKHQATMLHMHNGWHANARGLALSNKGYAMSLQRCLQSIGIDCNLKITSKVERSQVTVKIAEVSVLKDIESLLWSNIYRSDVSAFTCCKDAATEMTPCCCIAAASCGSQPCSSPQMGTWHCKTCRTAPFQADAPYRTDAVRGPSVKIWTRMWDLQILGILG